MTEALSRNGNNLAEAARPQTVLDPVAGRIARVYAEALYRAASQRGEVDGFLEELQSLIDDIFPADPQFETFLYSSIIGRDRKGELLEKTFKNKSSELFVNALRVLNDHERLDLLRPIVAEYRQLRDQRAGLVPVIVATPVPLAEDQRLRLERELKESLHKTPRIETRIDPDLLGGMVVWAGGWLYDGSIRTQLEEIRNHLLTRSSHEIQSRRDHFCSANGN
jgi:F-type H+-transporting ATPase subunit delta